MDGFWGNVVAIAFPSGILYFLSIVPLRRVWHARNWRATACIMLGSAVEEDHIESGLYQILVRYKYEVGGRLYRSSRYNFSVGTTAGLRGKRKVVARLAPGTRAICYVNPADPEDAVIDRGITWDMVFCGVFAAACLAAFSFFWLETGF